MSRLPEILRAARLYDSHVVDDAVRRSKKARACVVTAIDGVDAAVVARALAAALDVDVFPLRRVQPLSMGVPLEVLRRRRAVPAGPVVDGGVHFAVVALADPTDEEGITELAEHLGMPIRRALASDADVAFALKKLGASSAGFDLDEGPTEIELDLSLSADADLPRPTQVMAQPSQRTDVESALFASADGSDSSDDREDDDDDDDEEEEEEDLFPAAPSPTAVTAKNVRARPEARDARGGYDLDEGEGDTRRLLVDSGRVVLALSGGEALRLGDELRGGLPGVVLQHDLGAKEILTPAPLDRVIFVEARDAPFPRGLLETLLWQRERIVVVSADKALDALKGVLRIDPGKGEAGLVDAVLRAAFLS